MKKIFQVSIYIILITSSLGAQLQVRYKNWNGTGYDAPANFQSTGVASDFGPRKYGDFWHGGLDMNGPGDKTDDKYDLIIAHEKGIIVDENHVTHKSDNIRYPCIDFGNHRMVYVHAYYDGCESGCSMNDNTIIASNMIFPNSTKWATIYIIGNDTIVKGQVNGKVKFGNDTLIVSNIINIDDPIAPLGDSGTDNYHLHLNTIPDDKKVYNDSWNANPLQHITYDAPDYVLKLYSQLDTGNIKVEYSGTNSTNLALKVRLPNEANNSGTYNTVMDMNKAVFGIKKSHETNYTIIKGDAEKGIISLGGKINEDKLNHPDAIKHGKKFIELGSFGSWSITGQDAFSYTTSTPHPWDVYHFSDFKTRIHKDDDLTPISKHLYADSPENTRYNDGEYNVRAEAWHINNDSVPEYSEIENIKIDNYRPFITKFDLQGINQTIYSLNRIQEEGTNILNNGFISRGSPIINVNTNSTTNTFYVNTSEPLKELYISWKKGLEPSYNTATAMTNANGEGTRWSATILSLETAKYIFKFKGKDKSDNKLMNVYALSGNNGLTNVNIPVRNSATTWINNYASDTTSCDYVEFELACSYKVKNFRPDISSENRAAINCESLRSIREYATYNNATCSATIGLSGVDLINFHIGWQNAAGEYKLGATSKEVTTPGYHCYIVESTDGCCSREGCIFIENMLDVKPQVEESLCNGASIDLGIDTSAFAIAWTMTASLFPIPEYNNQSKIENLKGNFQYNYTVTKKNNNCATSGMVILEDIINPLRMSREPLTFAASECNSTDGYIRFLPYSINGGTYPYLYQWSNGDTTLNLENIPHGQYTLTVTDVNDCQVSKMYDLKFEGQIEVGYNYIERPCPGQANGVLAVFANQDVLYHCEAPYYQSNEPPTFENLSAGTYCITMTSAINDCILEKCYTLEDLDYQGPIVITGAVKKACVGESNGSVTLSISGGVPNLERPYYDVAWSNGGEGKYLAKGTYTVTVTDHCGNTATSSFEIEEYPYLPIDIQSKPTETYIANVVLGGSGNFSYKWEVETTYFLNGQLKTEWVVVSTQSGNAINTKKQQRFTAFDNLTGCFKIKYFDCIALSSSQLNTCEGWSEGKIDISKVYGDEPIEYKWSNGATTMDIDKLAKNNYTLIASNKTKDGNPLCSVKLDFVITDVVPEKQEPVFNEMGCGWNISCNNSGKKFKPYTGSDYKETPVGCNEIKVYCPTTGETKTKTLPLTVVKDFDLCAKVFVCPNTGEPVGTIEFPKETRFVDKCKKEERCSLGNGVNPWVFKEFVADSFCCPTAIATKYDTITGILTITVTAGKKVNILANLSIIKNGTSIKTLNNFNLQNAIYNWTIALMEKGEYTLRADFNDCPYMESPFSVNGISETPTNCPLILNIDPNPLGTNTDELDLQIDSKITENLTLKVLDGANNVFTSKTINLIVGSIKYPTTFDKELLAFTPFHLVFEKDGCKTSYPILTNEASCPTAVIAFPNQFKDKINLVAFSEMDLNATLNFINTASPYNVVLSKNIHFSIGENNIQVDISKDNIPNILYKLEVVFNNSTCNKIVIGEKQKVELKSPDPDCFKAYDIDINSQNDLLIFNENAGSNSNSITSGIVINPHTLKTIDTVFSFPKNGEIVKSFLSADGDVILFSNANDKVNISKVDYNGIPRWTIPFQNANIVSVAPINQENGNITVLLKNITDDFNLVLINNSGNVIRNTSWTPNSTIPISSALDHKIFLHNDKEYSILLKGDQNTIYHSKNEEVTFKSVDSNFEVSSIFKKYDQLYLVGTSNQELTIDNVSYQGYGYNSPTIMSLDEQLKVNKMKIHDRGSNALFVNGMAIDSNKIASIIHLPSTDSIHPIGCDEVIIIHLDSCICNPPSIQYDSLYCLLYWQSTCDEDSTILQISKPNGWTSISGNTTHFYEVFENPGAYRLVSYFGTCPILYSEEINVNCDTSLFCPANALNHSWVNDSMNVDIDLIKNLSFDLRIDYFGNDGNGSDPLPVVDSLFIPLTGIEGANTYKFGYEIIYDMPSNPTAFVTSYMMSISCPLCIDYCVMDSSFLALKPNDKVENRNTESTIVVYPNPFGSGFTIDIDADIEKNMAIEVYNATGIQIYKDNLPLAPHRNRYYLKESEFWQNGLYYIHFKDGDKDINLKIIKIE